MDLLDSKEKYKEISGFHDYFISNLGRVWSKKSNKHLKPQDNGNGYKFVALCVRSIPRQFYIHRLVCRAFNGPTANKRNEVNHIDGDKANNIGNNLEWVDSSGNKIHCYKTLGHKGRNIGKINGDNHPRAKKLNLFLIKRYFELGNIKSENIGNFMKCSVATLKRIKRGVHWQQRQQTALPY